MPDPTISHNSTIDRCPVDSETASTESAAFRAKDMSAGGQPFFYARKRGDHIETRGMSSCLLGHELLGNNMSQGPFVRWLWDGSRLQVWNDRYGFYPLYYWVREGEIGVSPSIPKLLAEGAPSELDAAGLAVFLRLGFFIGDHTPFQAIRAVPPSTTFEWKDGKLQVSGRFAVAKEARLSQIEASERFASLFKAAIQRRLPPNGEFAIPLSGGRDSRHILLALCEAGFRPKTCLTFRHLPPMLNWDATVASHLCEALGVPHTLLDQPRSRFRAELRSNIKTNLCADEHAQYLALADHVLDRFELLYDGIGGGMLSNGFLLDETRLALFEEARFQALAENLFAAFPRPTGFNHETLLVKLLQPDQYRRFGRDLAVSSLSAELIRHASAPNPVSSFFFWNRTRREVALAPFSILGEAAQVFCPYLDHDLYDFLTSLPARVFLNHTFHTQTIQRTYPRYAHIPFDYDVTAPNLEASDNYRLFGRELACYALAHGKSRYVRYSYLLPRLLKCAINAAYGETLFSYRHFGPHALYLLQLERVAENPRGCLSSN